MRKNVATYASIGQRVSLYSTLTYFYRWRCRLNMGYLAKQSISIDSCFIISFVKMNQRILAFLIPP